MKITLQYVGCKQWLGGIVRENLCDMQMPRKRRCHDKEGFEYNIHQLYKSWKFFLKM